jgi:hypothetical protein
MKYIKFTDVYEDEMVVNITQITHIREVNVKEEDTMKTITKIGLTNGREVSTKLSLDDVLCMIADAESSMVY